MLGNVEPRSISRIGPNMCSKFGTNLNPRKKLLSPELLVSPDLPAFKLYSEDLQKASLLAIETGGVYEMSLVSDIAKHAQRDIEDNGAVFAAGGRFCTKS